MVTYNVRVGFFSLLILFLSFQTPLAHRCTPPCTCSCPAGYNPNGPIGGTSKGSNPSTPGTGTPSTGSGSPGSSSPGTGSGTPSTGTPSTGSGTPSTGTSGGSGSPSSGTPSTGSGSPSSGTPSTGGDTPSTSTPPSSGTPSTGTPPSSGTPNTSTPPSSGTPSTGTPPSSGTPNTSTPPSSGTPTSAIPPSSGTTIPPSSDTPSTGSGSPSSGKPTTGTKSPTTGTPPSSGTPSTGATPSSGTPSTGTPPSSGTPSTGTPPSSGTPTSAIPPSSGTAIPPSSNTPSTGSGSPSSGTPTTGTKSPTTGTPPSSGTPSTGTPPSSGTPSTGTGTPPSSGTPSTGTDTPPSSGTPSTAIPPSSDTPSTGTDTPPSSGTPSTAIPPSSDTPSTNTPPSAEAPSSGSGTPSTGTETPSTGSGKPSSGSGTPVTGSETPSTGTSGTSITTTTYTGSFQKVFAFGGSYTDTGNCALLNGFKAFVGALQHKPRARQCDGRLVIDFLTETLGLPSLPPYKSSSLNHSCGVNFAISGSTSLTSNYFSNSPLVHPLIWDRPESFQTQIGWFVKFLIELKLKAASNFHAELSNSLFWVGEMGLNDYVRTFGSSLNSKWLTELTVNHVCNLLKTLLDSGANYVVVQGLPPAGCLPVDLSLCPFSDRDKMGCSASANLVIQAHNELLKKKIEEYRNQYSGSMIIYADYWGAYTTILSNPSKYGFQEPYKACCGCGTGLFNFKLHSLCGSPRSSVCQDPSKHISWDGIHLTEAMHKHVADLLLHGGFCQPSFADLVKHQLGK